MIRFIFRGWKCSDFSAEWGRNSRYPNPPYLGGLGMGPFAIDVWGRWQ